MCKDWLLTSRLQMGLLRSRLTNTGLGAGPVAVRESFGQPLASGIVENMG